MHRNHIFGDFSGGGGGGGGQDSLPNNLESAHELSPFHGFA